MSSLLVELEQKDILTAEAVNDIRKYIAAKFPSMPSKQRAHVFSDAVNRVVDSNIPDLSEEQKLKLKGNLFKEAFSKPVFKLDKSQVFIAALEVAAGEEDKGYLRRMTSWLGISLGFDLDEESVASFIIRVQRLKDEIPGYEIIDALRAVEKGLIEEVAAAAAEEKKSEDLFAAMQEDLPVIDFSNAEEASEDNKAADSAEPSQDLPVIIVNSEVLTVIQMLDTIKLPLRKRNSKSLKTHLGKVLVAAGFTGLVISSLLDFNIYISTGAQDIDTQKNLSAVVLKHNYSSYESFNYENPYIMEFNTGKVSEALNGVWKGKKTLKATAYDLSIESCGKQPKDPEYGITASGVKALKGRTIAVDPKVIPLGTKVYITFPEEYKHMNGAYVAEDTGRLIKGLHIDIFFGEDKNGGREIYQKAMKFGVQHVEAEIVAP